MILRALDHYTEDEIAEALNVDVSTIRKKRNLLNGACKEAVEILRDRRVSSDAFGVLRKMRPVRQVQTAQLMVASHTYTGRFAAALLTGTGTDMLVEDEKSRPAKTLPQAQRARPPSQHTRHSPKRESIVTSVFKRRTLFSRPWRVTEHPVPTPDTPSRSSD